MARILLYRKVIMERYCDNFSCDRIAKHFFESISTNGDKLYHALCNNCFYEMIEQ